MTGGSKPWSASFSKMLTLWPGHNVTFMSLKIGAAGDGEGLGDDGLPPPPPFFFGFALGFGDGFFVGFGVGFLVGFGDGFGVGFLVGFGDGFLLGLGEGFLLGLGDGFLVGFGVGLCDAFGFGVCEAVAVVDGVTLGPGESSATTVPAPLLCSFCTGAVATAPTNANQRTTATADAKVRAPFICCPFQNRMRPP